MPKFVIIRLKPTNENKYESSRDHDEGYRKCCIVIHNCHK